MVSTMALIPIIVAVFTVVVRYTGFYFLFYLPPVAFVGAIIYHFIDNIIIGPWLQKSTSLDNSELK